MATQSRAASVRAASHGAERPTRDHGNEARTLAVARGPEKGAIELVGLVTLYDPPRPDAKQLISELRDLGVAVKMLTGDALAVAREIAQGLEHVRDDQ